MKPSIIFDSPFVVGRASGINSFYKKYCVRMQAVLPRGRQTFSRFTLEMRKRQFATAALGRGSMLESIKKASPLVGRPAFSRIAMER
jgi:hypothetical protein